MSVRDDLDASQSIEDTPQPAVSPEEEEFFPTEESRLLEPRLSQSTPSLPALPFRQDLLWATLALSFFTFMCGTLLAFTISVRFQQFVILHANVLFTVPYVISFIVILACLAPWVPSSVAANSLGQMNSGVIASAADFLLVFLVLIEWAACLALMLVTLVSINEGLSFISSDGLIVPRSDPAAANFSPAPNSAVAGIPRNSPVILIVPLLSMYALFNTLIHLASFLEAIIRQRTSAV